MIRSGGFLSVQVVANKTSLVQMVEMLSLISTSQDKMSVSLADFGRMMVDAKLA